MSLFRFILKVPLNKHGIFILMGLLFSIPAYGFICGAYICNDCGFNLLSRIFVGLIWTVINTIDPLPSHCPSTTTDSIAIIQYLSTAIFIWFFATIISYLRYKKASKN